MGILTKYSLITHVPANCRGISEAQTLQGNSHGRDQACVVSAVAVIMRNAGQLSNVRLGEGNALPVERSANFESFRVRRD